MSIDDRVIEINVCRSLKDGYLQIQTNVSHIEMVIGIPMCTYNFLWGK